MNAHRRWEKRGEREKENSREEGKESTNEDADNDFVYSLIAHHDDDDDDDIAFLRHKGVCKSTGTLIEGE